MLLADKVDDMTLPGSAASKIKVHRDNNKRIILATEWQGYVIFVAQQEYSYYG